MTTKNRKKQLANQQRKEKRKLSQDYANAWYDEGLPTVTDEAFVPVELPDIAFEYIEHDEGGTIFLNLIQDKLGVALSVDDYHFHYFMAAGDTFVGVVECQIYEDLQTVSITKAAFNHEMREVGLTLISEALGDAFDNVYIGEVGDGGVHFIKDRIMSRMFNPWELPQIQSNIVKHIEADLDLEQYL